MSRIVPVVSSNVDAKVATTLSQVKVTLGMVPNLFATLAHAPVALDGLLSLSKTLSRGRLSAAQREIVALAVGQENECQYCLSAHTAKAKAEGVSEKDALMARAGDGVNPFERVLASFAKKIVRQRGHVSDEDIADAVYSSAFEALSLSNGSACAGDRPHEAWLTKPMLTSVIVRSDTVLSY